jgi:hypothetical protein
MEMRLTSSNLNFYQRSLASSEEMEFGLAQTRKGPILAVLARSGSNANEAFDGETSEFGDHILMLCPLNSCNASSLRNNLTWLKPRTLGLRTSTGMGDRLGIATPGHVRAVRDTQGKVAPIFAQQSIREMRRTGRSPQQVMDDATWGIFEEGWQGGIGSDADHLKTKADIDSCIAAGFTLFTIDPGEYVDNNGQKKNNHQLTKQLELLPEYLQPKATGLLGKSFDIEGFKLFVDEAALLKAITKYGKAVAHVTNMYEYLVQIAGKHPFEVEVSMDETEMPTSPIEHVYIASELRRLGVKWISFAPRFVGRFEKGVDYIGDLNAFETDMAVHAAIARQFGPYKLSLHSGSDKFSIYRMFMEKTNGLAHLKTAGTSYLEALRTIAALDRDLFKEIYIFALEHFDADKLSYHISAQINKAPKPSEIKDWPGLLDLFDAREILHVTFGSVLTEKRGDGKMRFYDRLMSVLYANRETYFDNLEYHFRRHLKPFSTLSEG